jgi:hypothetical protein
MARHLLDTVGYPCSVEEATDRFDDPTLELASILVNIGAVVADSISGAFASADDLSIEFISVLLRRAVGEPFQSEGEG